MLILLSVAAALACPATTASLDHDIAEATARYLALDLDGFDAASSAVLAEATCLVEPASPATAAGLHRTRALRAWVARDTPGMLAALAAMRAAAPETPIDPRLVPPGSRLHEVYEAARPDAGRMAALPGGGWVVDGRPDALLAPLARATLVQHLDPGGGAPETWYFPVGADLDQLAPTPAPLAPEPLPVAGSQVAALPTTLRPAHTSRTLAIGSGAALLVGAASLLAAATTRAEYLASGPEDGPREDLYALNIATGTAGLAGCTAAVGLFAGAVWVGQW